MQMVFERGDIPAPIVAKDVHLRGGPIRPGGLAGRVPPMFHPERRRVRIPWVVFHWVEDKVDGLEAMSIVLLTIEKVVSTQALAKQPTARPPWPLV